MSRMPTPDPSIVLIAWTEAQARAEAVYPDSGIEISTIIVQDTAEDADNSVVCVAYVETGESFGEQCDHLMGHLVNEPAPPQWIAHAGGAYEVVGTTDMLATFGADFDLQEKFKEGDERVREIIAVTIVTTDSVITQSFVPPLLEPTGEPRVNMAVGGIVPNTLRLMVTVLNDKETTS